MYFHEYLVMMLYPSGQWRENEGSQTSTVSSRHQRQRHRGTNLPRLAQRFQNTYQADNSAKEPKGRRYQSSALRRGAPKSKVYCKPPM